MAKCAMPLSYLKGGVSMYLPPKSRRTKRTGSLTDPAQTNPSILKSVNEYYQNLDPVAHMVGKVNETKILVDNVECLALVDSGA